MFDLFAEEQGEETPAEEGCYGGAKVFAIGDYMESQAGDRESRAAPHDAGGTWLGPQCRHEQVNHKNGKESGIPDADPPECSAVEDSHETGEDSHETGEEKAVDELGPQCRHEQVNHKNGKELEAEIPDRDTGGLQRVLEESHETGEDSQRGEVKFFKLSPADTADIAQKSPPADVSEHCAISPVMCVW